MPQGTIQAEIQKVEQAFSAIQALLGGADAGGFAGGAALAANAPGAQIASLQSSFSSSLSGILTFDASAKLDGVDDFFTNLSADATLGPSTALTQFGDRVAALDSAFSGDFSGQVSSVLALVRGLSQEVPSDRTAVVGALVDQILRVLASLEGPEADTLRAWIAAAREMQTRLAPIIEAAQDSPDPASALVAVIERALTSTLDTFGYAEIERFFKMLDSFIPELAPEQLLTGIAGAHGAALRALDDAGTTLNGSFPEFREAALDVALALNDLDDQLRQLVRQLRRLADAKFLQPRALEEFLQRKLDEVLGVQVLDTQRIDEQFLGLFDRVDGAIAGIDLGFVRTEVLGFFDQLQSTLDSVDIPSLGDQLKQGLAPLRGAVDQVQAGVDGLLAQVRDFFSSLTEKYRDLASRIGTFDPDGSFHFAVEGELRTLLGNARTLVAGDPSDPDAPSVAHTLHELESSLSGFLEQLTSVLQPIEQAIGAAASSAVSAANEFSAFLAGLDIPALIVQLTERVRELLDAVGTVQFDVVIDPVISGIEENTAKLRSIDPSKLNDLLRAALKVALDVVISIDFTASIREPLSAELAKVKAVPRQALDELQQRYEQALSVLDQLKPTQLLKALFDAFDVIQSAAGSLDIAPLLQPLDDLHRQLLQEPVAALRPSQLLAPVSEGYRSAIAGFADVEGAALLAPLDGLLSSVKSKLLGFDIAQPIDELLQAIAKLKQDLREIRPSEILDRLLPELSRLDEALDRFKPSALLQPLTSLAQPLLAFLENVQQETIQRLFDLFQQPLRLLDRLQPQALTREIQQQLDGFLARLDALNVPFALAQLKGKAFDLHLAVQAQGSEMRLNLASALCDPERTLGALLASYNELVAIIRGLRANAELPSLTSLYDQVKDRVLALAPAYARELLDPVRFRRLLRLADPTRFAAELDVRFEAVKAKLLPIRPADIAAELDETYQALLARVEALDVAAPLEEVKQLFTQLRAVVSSVRVDFLARDIDQALSDLRAMLDALDPARFFAELDALHAELEAIVASTRPSALLAPLQAPLDTMQQLVASVDPRLLLGQPLDDAWASVDAALREIDFRVVLGPLVDKLDELESEFFASLQKTETAFDTMLGAASSALGGSGASTSVSL